ncbi:MAG: hypothetical protein Q9171_004826 [Xanthocarpia ochracea]
MPKRKAPPRAAKKDRYDLDQLLTSSKSRLIDIDLHGMLAGFFGDPANWAQVPDDDKQFIQSLLPSHVELDEHDTIPDDFWKYNPEFRLDCRNLQEDLRAGRMDPEWQRQAHQAMEERATGAYDNFKEREFEEYWGQKQKVDSKYLAGDASKVRLDELLAAGLFKEGDVWSFDHTFGRRDKAVTIQKECQIVSIDGKTVTLNIPPGQSKFARRFDEPTASVIDQAMPPQSTVLSSTADTLDDDAATEETLSPAEKPMNISKPTSLVDRSKVKDDLKVSVAGTATKHGRNKKNVSRAKPEIPTAPVTPSLRSAKSTGSSNKEATHTKTKISTQTISDHSVISYSISTLGALEKKIIQIDGRVRPESRTASTWRDIRCRRKEQDMGSLFEIRDEYYAYQVEGKD